MWVGAGTVARHGRASGRPLTWLQPKQDRVA